MNFFENSPGACRHSDDLARLVLCETDAPSSVKPDEIARAHLGPPAIPRRDRAVIVCLHLEVLHVRTLVRAGMAEVVRAIRTGEAGQPCRSLRLGCRHLRLSLIREIPVQDGPSDLE